MWRRTHKFFELIVEMADVVVAQLHAYFCYIFAGSYQKFLPQADSQANQVLNRGEPENFLEVVREARHAHVCDLAQLLD